jgi:hypothetical protein
MESFDLMAAPGGNQSIIMMNAVAMALALSLEFPVLFIHLHRLGLFH